jgi:hypothetical protein
MIYKKNNYTYKQTTVTKEFIQHRDKLADDLKGENTTFRADFEWPEWYLGKVIPTLSLHERFYGYSYDTTHPDYGRCEFKYLPKTGLVHIGLYTQRQQFDNYIFWNWEKRFNHLSEGDIIDFDIIDVVKRDFVNKNIDNIKFDYNKHVLNKENVV